MSVLNQATVIVIGGSSGIGNQVARHAANLGANILITGRDEQKLDRALNELQALSTSVRGRILDTNKPRDLAAFFRDVAPFDHLVSMLGGYMGGGFLGVPIAEIHRAVENKLFANIQIAQLAAPHLKDHGSLVLTSGAGGRPDTASGAIVGNMGIRLLVEGLALELAPRARVNAVAPTWMRTPLYRDLPDAEVTATEKRFTDVIPLRRTATLDEVASAYTFLMANSFITGQTIVVDGGLTLTDPG